MTRHRDSVDLQTFVPALIGLGITAAALWYIISTMMGSDWALTTLLVGVLALAFAVAE